MRRAEDGTALSYLWVNLHLDCLPPSLSPSALMQSVKGMLDVDSAVIGTHCAIRYNQRVCKSFLIEAPSLRDCRSPRPKGIWVVTLLAKLHLHLG